MSPLASASVTRVSKPRQQDPRVVRADLVGLILAGADDLQSAVRKGVPIDGPSRKKGRETDDYTVLEEHRELHRSGASPRRTRATTTGSREG